MDVSRRSFLKGLGIGGLGAVLPSKVFASPEGSFLDIPLYDAKGRLKTLSTYYGIPLLLNFWAPYCRPCLEEIPQVNGLLQKIRILAVCSDPSFGRNESAKSKNFSTILPEALRKNMKFENVFISLESLASLSGDHKKQYGQNILFPTFSVVNSLGKITYTRLGALKDGTNYSDLLTAVTSVR